MNGGLELRPCGKTFRCLVANFSLHAVSIFIRKGHVVAYAESVQEVPVRTFPITEDTEDLVPFPTESVVPTPTAVQRDWKDTVHSSATRFSEKRVDPDDEETSRDVGWSFG
jgi:hypothetical protein